VPKPGTIIADRYSIVRLIGEGGMGVVYEARHTSIGRRVALKVVHKEYSSNAVAIERFQQEAKVAATIGHLNICEVMDFGVTDDGLAYIVMEYLEGESLATILGRERKLPVDVAMSILMQIMDALEEVHAKGILHRDLKPENVFITNVKGHGAVVKILDFGISKVMKPGADSMRLTQTGTMVGTPYYMSPEHVRAKGDIDQRTDLYACGVILYEMVTGEVPFKGESYSQIIAAILEDPPPDPTRLTPGLSQAVVDFIRWGMQRDREKRPQTAAEYRDKARFLAGTLPDIGPPRGKLPQFGRTKLDSLVISPDSSDKRIGARRLLMIAGTIAAVIMATLIVVVSIYLIGRGDRAVGAPDAESEGAGGSVSPGAPADVVQPPGASTVKITLTGAPDGLRVSHDGTETRGSVVELEKGSSPVRLVLGAEGFESREIDVVPSTDMEIDGRLETAGPTKKPRKGQGKKKTTQETSSPAGKKKQKLDHVWAYPE
jgi:tRNA A-37 threonylcarbamoyl transferase component Bud32